MLDEPTTGAPNAGRGMTLLGVDIETRRFLWDRIVETTSGRSFVLTSHAMDEVEALCNRM